MLPIYIICHANCVPHDYLCSFFDERNIPYYKINIISDDISRIDHDAVSGLVFMGGPHSVNDNPQWLADEIIFIRQAIEKNIPVMGVCFGAQLISKVLGAKVSRAEHMETGWHQISVDTSKAGTGITLNFENSFEVFEWHEDTFSIPETGIPIFTGRNFKNQGYLAGNVLAMQFHLEMTESMVFEWLERYQDCIPEPSRYVQSPEQISEHLSERLEKLHEVADKVYDWWLNRVRNQ
ncbi:MAG: type 1 glutamine amidotransferase [Gammaproteobacteria bacterium]|nr:type 1 glutamine amidotransferase [Gammaproteobacteria bacterium]MCW8909407.1 type 1 glutamine amidotransferase [Gammaproteobacteria bacterium]MCW9004233.1 type 1 glutamine amidotransferase [Gammaproteobacteria bacterium]MCW9055202.1 type 1 glutamine amidotransferase [Gammaproteobacteria bacterium]